MTKTKQMKEYEVKCLGELKIEIPYPSGATIVFKGDLLCKDAYPTDKELDGISIAVRHIKKLFQSSTDAVGGVQEHPPGTSTLIYDADKNFLGSIRHS